MMRRVFTLPGLLVTALILVACSSQGSPTAIPTIPATDMPLVAQPQTEAANPRLEDNSNYHINFLLGPDGIPPIYEPRFVSAADAPLKDDELVIAVSIDGESKAYPISVLHGREMVNDELGGTPILVSW